ncbi:cobyrinate a,c-diamide synthase [Noviherbaspirillum saxi]|uniref:Cobyrinate a,c-diamide synthase n=1 Tax=Noviherbaspirillum saxi TaxID=2320863 RepID=A0A3A3GGE9_9BURK|nr:cobyrinate a,c-diamide synthase [Noviherbaspirillum saxi]RJF99979.1 cobyrinate a,c-diamide synthase [Noviherbaspirillum saxi]
MTTAPASARVVLISAIASGQGKTTVTAALARKLRQQGKRVRVFKTGPDFLDPMMLERASGHPVYSLDLWMVGHAASRRLLARAAAEADAILIEGVMGLYDGTPSSADLAGAFNVPVLAVLDASAMAQTAGAVVHGLRDYGPVDLAGVIANRVGSARHAQMIDEAMRDIPLLGTLARQEKSLPERHLGLVQADEVSDLESLLDGLAGQLDMPEHAWDLFPVTTLAYDPQDETIEPVLKGKTIAIARDAAFAFLYPANIDCLQALGAQCVFFSPLANEAIPPHADGVYLPGGYPELHGQALADATQWQQSILQAHAAQVPILAECGGMMALADELTGLDGATWPMAGVLPGRVSMQKRLAALGPQAWATEHGELRGHAFHYSSLDSSLAPAAYAIKHSTGTQGEAIYRLGSLTASYFHAYFPSCPEAVAGVFNGQERT